MFVIMAKGDLTVPVFKTAYEGTEIRIPMFNVLEGDFSVIPSGEEEFEEFQEEVIETLGLVASAAVPSYQYFVEKARGLSEIITNRIKDYYPLENFPDFKFFLREDEYQYIVQDYPDGIEEPFAIVEIINNYSGRGFEMPDDFLDKFEDTHPELSEYADEYGNYQLNISEIMIGNYRDCPWTHVSGMLIQEDDVSGELAGQIEISFQVKTNLWQHFMTIEKLGDRCFANGSDNAAPK